MNTIKDRQADRHTHTNTKLQSFSLPSQYLANGLCLKEFSSSIHTLTWNKCKHQSFGFIHSSKVAITGRDHFCLLKLQLGIKTLHAEFWSQFFMSPNWQALFFFSLFVFFLLQFALHMANNNKNKNKSSIQKHTEYRVAQMSSNYIKLLDLQLRI